MLLNSLFYEAQITKSASNILHLNQCTVTHLIVDCHTISQVLGWWSLVRQPSKMNLCGVCFCSIGAEHTSVLNCLHKRFKLTYCRGHASSPALHNHLSRQVLQSTFSTVQLKCPGSPSFMNHALPPNTYFQAVMEDHFKRNCLIH